MSKPQFYIRNSQKKAQKMMNSGHNIQIEQNLNNLASDLPSFKTKSGERSRKCSPIIDFSKTIDYNCTVIGKKGLQDSLLHVSKRWDKHDSYIMRPRKTTSSYFPKRFQEKERSKQFNNFMVSTTKATSYTKKQIWTMQKNEQLQERMKSKRSKSVRECRLMYDREGKYKKRVRNQDGVLSAWETEKYELGDEILI